MKRRAVLGASLLASAFLASTTPAGAETADELFERGRALAVAQRFAEACPVLAESVRIEPGIGARLWLGECYEKMGRLASALSEFKAAAAHAGQHKDDREKVAVRRASALDARVSRVLVLAPEGVSLTVDGTPTAAGVADPVDAGLHTVVATAPGFARWSASVFVPSTPGTVTVNVPALEPQADAPPAPAPPPAPATPVRPTPVAAQVPGVAPLRIASLASGALGVAALGGGVFLGLRAKATYDSSNEDGHCVDNACDAAGKDLRRSATQTATLSTIAFAGAGVALATSVVFFVLSPSTTVSPAVGPTEAGAGIAHRF